MTRFSKLIVAAGIALVIGVFSPRPAHAAFTLTLSETGFASRTITWGSPPNNSLSGGDLFLGFGSGPPNSVTYGTFVFSQISAISTSNSPVLNNGLADVSITMSNLTSTNASKTLVVTATDTGFTFPYSSDTVLSTGSATINPPGAPGKATFSGTVSNVHDTVLAPPLILIPGSHGGSTSQTIVSASTFNPDATPYTITSVYTITGLKTKPNQFVSIGGNIELTSTTPAPASLALAAAGFCLIGGGAWLKGKLGRKLNPRTDAGKS